MIGSVWSAVVEDLKTLGWMLDPSESDSLMDRHYTIQLPEAERDTTASVVGRARVIRDVRVRLQFRDRKDAYIQKTMAEEIEKVVVALRQAPFWFERSAIETRPGGYIAEIEFSVRDSMN